MVYTYKILIFFLFRTVICQKSLEELENYISTYELIHIFYNKSEILNSLRLNTYFHFYFKAFGEDFNATCKIRDPIFPNAQVFVYNETKIPNEIPPLSVRSIEGRLKGDQEDTIYGYFDVKRMAIFTGQIIKDEDTYNVDPLSNFLESEDSILIVYRNSDIYEKPILADTCKEHVNLSTSSFKANPLPLEYFSEIETGLNCRLDILIGFSYFDYFGQNVDIVLSNIYETLDVANRVFNRADFNRDGMADNTGFELRNIYIITVEIADIFGNETQNSEEMLYRCGQWEQDACLLLCLIHTKFSDKVVGLAYTAGPSFDMVGGICDMHIRNGIEHVNTAIVTSSGFIGDLNVNSFGVSVAHELGHNFGALHDEKKGNRFCYPKSKEGLFVMAPMKNIHPKGNNFRFSPCSLNNIKNVIQAKGECLVKRTKVCGNQILDEGEECDCGSAAMCDFVDPCCTPVEGFGANKPCTLRRDINYQCTPKKDPCCSNECQIIPSWKRKKCYSGDEECSKPSLCDGRSSLCKTSKAKKDGMTCSSRYSTCKKGRCTSNVCSDKNLTLCFCEDPLEQCHICCMGQNKRCFSTVTAGWRSFDGMKFIREILSPCPLSYGSCDLEGYCSLNPMFPTTTTTKPPRKQFNWRTFIIIYILCLIFSLLFFIFLICFIRI